MEICGRQGFSFNSTLFCSSYQRPDNLFTIRMFAYCLCLLVFIRHYTCSYCRWNWGAAIVNKEDVMVKCRSYRTWYDLNTFLSFQYYDDVSGLWCNRSSETRRKSETKRTISYRSLSWNSSSSRNHEEKTGDRRSDSGATQPLSSVRGENYLNNL